MEMGTGVANRTANFTLWAWSCALLLKTLASPASCKNSFVHVTDHSVAHLVVHLVVLYESPSVDRRPLRELSQTLFVDFR